MSTLKCRELNFEELDALFKIDSTSHTVLRRKEHSGHWLAGKVAGTINRDKYKQPRCYSVMANGMKTSVHRTIWVLQNGSIPNNMAIDHINGNGLDNRIENLRLVTIKENGRNQKKFKKNSSGITGVGITKDGKYTFAHWVDVHGVNKKTTFNIGKLGFDAALQLAIKDREQAIAIVCAAGEGYSERHGT